MEDLKLHLSPSEFHRHLMDRVEPALAYKGGDVKAWQRKLRAKLRELLGEMPAKRVALDVRSLWSREFPLGQVEKVAFTAEPCSDVVAYVCLPKEAKPPYTWMICLQGHSSGAHNSIGVDLYDETKKIDVPGGHDYALGCMRRGIAALAIEQRSFGFRGEKDQQQVAPASCHDATMQALMLGRTLLGERVFDVDRGIDYLLTRKDVDPKRIGVMGTSGGGTISVFSSALLPRLSFAMPACYFCTLRDSVMSVGGCVDNYIPGLYLWAENADIMGLFAPKPVVIVAGEKDHIFPIAAARKTFKHLQEIYAAAGAPGRCRFVVGPEGHRFYEDIAWSAMLPELERM